MNFRDIVSHFILRLAYCSTEDLRRWFLQQECSLLKYRLESMSDEDRADFMSMNGLNFEQVTRDEKIDRQEVLSSIPGMNGINVLRQPYFKVFDIYFVFVFFK